jgi:GNAT superfamily N-acetyltransferase
MAGLLQQNPGPELIGMWVARHERGQGVGAMLTRAVVDLATSQGAPSVGLWVTDGNDTARACTNDSGSSSPASGRHCHTMPPPANTK